MHITTASKDVILNAPVMSMADEASLNKICDRNPNYDLVHDKVIRICPRDGTVTIKFRRRPTTRSSQLLRTLSSPQR